VSDQWKRCRDAGLTIVVSKPVGGTGVTGWICADAVEAMLDDQRTVEFGPDVDGDSAAFCPKIITLREFDNE
jgi:hypothetical protein